jgi:hypothetical protein
MSAANTLSTPSLAASITGAYAISPKALLYSDGAGATPAILNGFNIASIDGTSATGVYIITFSTAFPDTNYVVVASSPNRIALATPTSTTTATVSLFTVASPPVAQDGVFSMTVFRA